MNRRYALVLVAATLALLSFAPAASAATSQQIITDAISDGYIDGSYTLSQLRAADRAVTPAEREYYGWDAAYADAVRRLAATNAGGNKNADIKVVPIDANQNGAIDPEELAKAKAKEAELKKKRVVKATSRDDDNIAVPAATKGDDDSDDDDKDDDSGTPWFAWLLLIIPIVIIGIGIWRMKKTDGFTPPTRDVDPAAEDDAPGSSFEQGPDAE